MTHYKMSDVAVEINERENNPASSKYERFVGLEHYVSGEVIIRKYGSTENLESTMKVFQRGDVLVARRNVYLKRASMVDFDGLTSGDSIVLRAKNPIIGRILPFVLNTDSFWDFADQYSDGTMSKRLSPKTLMTYEFDLPDEDELEKFADLLWAANDTRESYQALLRQTDELVKSQFIEMSALWENEYSYEPLSNYMDRITYGFTNPMPDTYEGPWKVTAKDIIDGKIAFSSARNTSQSEFNKLTAKSKPKINDVLLTKDGTLGRVAVVDCDNICINQSVALISCNNKIIPQFLASLLQMPPYQEKLLADAGGTTVKHLYITKVDKMPICVPAKADQKRWLELVEQTDKSKFEIKKAIENTSALIKSLMQQDLTN